MVSVYTLRASSSEYRDGESADADSVSTTVSGPSSAASSMTATGITTLVASAGTSTVPLLAMV